MGEIEKQLPRFREAENKCGGEVLFFGGNRSDHGWIRQKRQFADHRTIALRDVHRGIRVETPIDFVQQNALYRIA